MNHAKPLVPIVVILTVLILPGTARAFDGQFFRGEGDDEYLQLLDTARRMFSADPEFQSIGMLYAASWNGFVEGPTWGAWWVQNSYGPTYCALPFYVEPYVTFLQNAQNLWFDQMGDGRRVGYHDWVGPDGCLCDAAAPEWIVYKQGDGRVDIHDWGMEFTAAGLLMQSELLLIGHDPEAIVRYLPKLERCANFIETRRDPGNNLFLAGPAGNLLAPSYAGWRKDDGTYDKAYLAGLSVTYIAALDRLTELERFAGAPEAVDRYAGRRDLARKGLDALTEPEGYIIRSLDPDGDRHGVYGAKKHGYFEASPNHDAICFRVVDDAQAARIYAKIASIPGLRPNDFILPNCPGYDDMYEAPTSWLWKFGTWVNGGHWSTCEARMVMGYYRLGKFEDARKSMRKVLTFARDFRMDNPLVDFGNAVYQPNQPINLCYDTFGGPAAMIRGLFEYCYGAQDLTLIPHIPTGIARLEQKFPIRFGAKRLYLSTAGQGPISSVFINGKLWDNRTADRISLPYDQLPEVARIEIAFGGASLEPASAPTEESAPKPLPPRDDPFWDVSAFAVPFGGNTLPLRIGADSEGNNRFLGCIARARVFPQALPDDVVVALASNVDAEPPAALEPVADWRLGSLDAGIVPNARGDAPPAKVSGDLAVVDTDRGKSAEFKGQGFLEVAHDTALALDESYTVDAWIRPEKLPETGARIVDKVKAGVDNGYLLDTCPGNSLRLITEQGTLGYDAKLEPGAWHHVAGTFDARRGLALYLDGRKVAASPVKPATGPEVLREAGAFYNRLLETGLGRTYEASHAKLIADYVAAIHERQRLIEDKKIKILEEPSQSAANRSYIEAAVRLAEGLRKAVASYETSSDTEERKLAALWEGTGDAQEERSANR